MATSNVYINLSFSTSSGSYTLSSSDTSLVQISSDNKSYYVNGEIFTPSVNKTANYDYSYTYPTIYVSSSSGSVYGDTGYVYTYETNYTETFNHDYQFSNYVEWDSTIFVSDGGSYDLVSSQNDSDYASSARYKRRASTTKYIYRSVSVNKLTGVVSGDTSICNAEDIVRDYGTTTRSYYFKKVIWHASSGSYSYVSGDFSNNTDTSKTSASATFRKSTLKNYTHNSTNWNYHIPTDGVNFQFTDKNGNIVEVNHGKIGETKTRLELQVPIVKFIDKNGNTTIIRKLGGSAN